MGVDDMYDNTDDELCAIYLEPLLAWSWTCSECRNRVHQECIERWSARSCPFCRRDLKAKLTPCEALLIALFVSLFIGIFGRETIPSGPNKTFF